MLSFDLKHHVSLSSIYSLTPSLTHTLSPSPLILPYSYTHTHKYTLTYRAHPEGLHSRRDRGLLTLSDQTLPPGEKKWLGRISAIHPCYTVYNRIVTGCYAKHHVNYCCYCGYEGNSNDQDAVLHHTTSHHITSHHITSHHITSHHITSPHITSHHITSHHITSHHITSHHITSHHIT
jgi:hypothetical protein